MKNFFVVIICFATSFVIPVQADILPNSIGQCRNTFVKEILYRLSSPDENGVYIPVVGSGSAIKYTNGGYQVSYKDLSVIHKSQSGDKVRLCLTFIPDCTNAKSGDRRGRIYLATNLRTNESWELPDSQHRCGGA